MQVCGRVLLAGLVRAEWRAAASWYACDSGAGWCGATLCAGLAWLLLAGWRAAASQGLVCRGWFRQRGVELRCAA